MKYYNIRFRVDINDEWSYLKVAGTQKDILHDIISLRKMGFKEVEYGHYNIPEINGKTVKLK